ncbi:MAG TPA: M48 family metallopeptidase [Candidatus Bathyarchaeia archaeon]|nr:M48 family metallopeptidase [Candidatus Bathyarchaeia archaeon]
MLNVYEQIDANKRKSALIIALFVGFLTLTIYVFSRAYGYGLSVVGWALLLTGLSSLVGYYQGDRIILALSQAQPASREKNFQFFTVTENLAMAAQIPMPKLYLIEDTAMNAFATGRDPQHASICATSGLIKRLDRTELEGVIAHELAHIKNFDIRLMSIVTVLVGLVTLLADWLLRSSHWQGGERRKSKGGLLLLIGLFLAFLSPLIAKLIQLAISRSREYLADASGVMLTRFPDGLARALEKISSDKEPLEAANKATAHLYIANPLKNRHDQIGWFASFFNTHPPIGERIKKLKEMA